MNEYTQHIISRLKQQARHGMDINLTEEEEEARGKLSKTSITKNQETTTKLLKTTYDALAKSIDNLATSEAARATGIQKIIGQQQELAKVVQKQIDAANMLAKRNAELQKSYGLNTAEAAKLGYELDGLAVSLGTSRANVEKNYAALRKLTGGTRANTETMQRLNQYYSVNRGLTQEATDGLLAYAAAQTKGGTDEEIQKQVLSQQMLYAEIEKTLKIKGAQKDIEEAIGSAAAGTRLTFKKYPAQLGMAVMKAKALGLELADLETVGDNLLNIESSVGEELNYQLLTGHRLVDNNQKSLTNKYREAYLTGKSAEAAQTLANIVTQEGDTLENNLLARKQMAKVLGIEEEKLNSMVEKRKLIKGLTDASGKPLSVDLISKTGKDLEEGIRKAMAGKTETEIEAAVKAAMTADDTRDPSTRAADSLASIEANGIKLQMGSEQGAIELITKTAEASKQMVTEFGKTMGDGSDFQVFAKGYREQIGKLSIEYEKFNEGQESLLTSLFNLEKAVGGVTATVSTYFQEVLLGAGKAIPDAIKNAFGKNAMQLENMTVTNLVTSAEMKDGVMINDGIRFNPRDKFRTINDGMTIAGTNVGGLDRYAAQLEKRDRTFEQNMSRMITNMASTITQAIERANLKINIDRSFGGTSMNPRGKYGA